MPVRASDHSMQCALGSYDWRETGAPIWAIKGGEGEGTLSTAERALDWETRGRSNNSRIFIRMHFSYSLYFQRMHEAGMITLSYIFIWLVTLLYYKFLKSWGVEVEGLFDDHN